MNAFQSIGVNAKQGALYQFLLENGPQTASDIATGLSEQRTNVYLLVEHLTELGLVERDELQPVVRFKATDPAVISELISKRQRDLSSQFNALKSQLPELTGLFQLNVASEGMAYFEGITGYEATLDDMAKSGEHVRVFGASELGVHRPDARRILNMKLQKRALNKVKTDILLAKDLCDVTDLPGTPTSAGSAFVETRFWGSESFGSGEISLYADTVVLTSYDEKLISLVLKNTSIAMIFRAIFDTAWNSAAAR